MKLVIGLPVAFAAEQRAMVGELASEEREKGGGVSKVGVFWWGWRLNVEMEERGF